MIVRHALCALTALVVGASRAHAQGVPSDLRAAAFRHADELAREGRWTDAAATVEPFATDSASRGLLARLLVNAGVASWQAGDRAAAGRAWERALRADPTSEDATLDLATLLAGDGKADSAARRLGALRSRRASDERVGLALAAAQAMAGNARGAAALYDTLLSADGASEAAFAAATRFWTGTGRVELAVTTAQQGLTKYPRSGELLMLQGGAQSSQQKWRDAAAAYREAASLIERREDAELPLLDALTAAHDTAAVLELARTLADRPASRTARLIAASVADSLGKSDTARTIYTALIAADSVDLDALEADARSAERAGDTTLAADLYRRAAEVDSSGAEPPLALVRLTRPAPDSARQLLRRALWHGMAALERVEAAFFGASAEGGRTPGPGAVDRFEAARRNRIREAVVTALDRAVLGEAWGAQELEQLRLAWPGSALLERYEAQVAERRGDDAGALAVTDRLLHSAPADADLQRMRGRLLERLGRTSDAADAYTRAFDLAPEDDSTFRAVQRIDEARGRLAEVLAQVRRLRIRCPDSPILADHETEVMQRLGTSGGAHP